MTRHHVPAREADEHRPGLDCPCHPAAREVCPGDVDHHPMSAGQRQEVDHDAATHVEHHVAAA